MQDRRVQKLCDHVCCSFKPPHTQDAMQMLLFTLISVPKNYRVVIFLDSLDQLSAYGKVWCLYRTGCGCLEPLSLWQGSLSWCKCTFTVF